MGIRRRDSADVDEFYSTAIAADAKGNSSSPSRMDIIPATMRRMPLILANCFAQGAQVFRRGEAPGLNFLPAHAPVPS